MQENKPDDYSAKKTVRHYENVSFRPLAQKFQGVDCTISNNLKIFAVFIVPRSYMQYGATHRNSQ